jgi:hypothetical protein
VTRPLTRTELAKESRRGWYIGEEEKARGSRGDLGAMEFWLRIARSQIAKEIRAGRTDTWAGFALVCRLFTTAMQLRAAGQRRCWDDLLKYAQDVVDRNPPRDPA